MKLNIGILGTRGIPNHYGGFEQFASYLSEGLVSKGHSVSVYSSHSHLYQDNTWNGVEIIHCFDPEYLLGTVGQFIYDFNCIRDARKRKFDILLVLGYTSSSVWGRLFPKNSLVITNMDGLEWKRAKYSNLVQRFLKYAEKLAIKYSKIHVADSIPIKEYLTEKYHINAHYISYGAEIPTDIDASILTRYSVKNGGYMLLIARMEPENNVETVLDAVQGNLEAQKVLVIGSTNNKYGQKLKAKYRDEQKIVFLGPVFDLSDLNTLRSYCSIYYHGHSVGGTNPSLLEAMACGALICAHDNAFNRAVLQEDAYYFFSSEEIKNMINEKGSVNEREQMISNNLQKIQKRHDWNLIIDSYEKLFLDSVKTVS